MTRLQPDRSAPPSRHPNGATPVGLEETLAGGLAAYAFHADVPDALPALVAALVDGGSAG